jgi:hypothetical protein
MKIVHAATDVKAGAAVAATTISTGAGSFFQWIPSDIGLFAALVGAILSIVLIITHICKFVIAYKEAKIRIAKAEKELED